MFIIEEKALVFVEAEGTDAKRGSIDVSYFTTDFHGGFHPVHIGLFDTPTLGRRQ